MRATFSWLWPKTLSRLVTRSPTSRPMIASTTRISRMLNARESRRKEEAERNMVKESGLAVLGRRLRLLVGALRATAAEFIDHRLRFGGQVAHHRGGLASARTRTAPHAFA